jgi:signal transduction histidine kinase
MSPSSLRPTRSFGLSGSAGQIIAALHMKLVPIMENEKSKPEIDEVIRESLELLQQLSTEVRTISHSLHPPLLDEVGLSSALRLFVEGFSERSKISVKLDIPSDFDRLSRELETAIFRVVQYACLSRDVTPRLPKTSRWSIS